MALIPDEPSRAGVARLPGAPEPLTVDTGELAVELRCSRRHVEAMDRDGRLGPQGIRLGRRRVWLRSEVQAWLAAGAPDRVTWLAIRSERAPRGATVARRSGRRMGRPDLH